MTIPPLHWRWEGDVARPLRPSLADKHLVVGEVYEFVEHRDRSQASHNHYFATVAELWSNLPDALAAEYPTAEHLRKKMLIQAGYYDERDTVLGSHADALRVAAMARDLDEYAVAIVRDKVVRIHRAKSQSFRAMGKKDFQESKDAVLSAIRALLGIDEKVAA